MALLDSRQVDTMSIDVVEPVFYIYSIFPRKIRYSWGLAVSRLAAGKMIYNKLNQLGNSFNIFTPGDVQNTNVACQHSQQHCFNALCLLGCKSGSASRHRTNVC